MESRERPQVSREACPCATMETACRFCPFVLLPPPPLPPPPPPPPSREMTFSVRPSAAPDVKLELLPVLMIVIPASLIVLVAVFVVCFKVLSRKQSKKEEDGMNAGASTSNTLTSTNDRVQF
ncbi:proline-rich membrane anchor 1-like isoform X2 [Cololabis saira]|uniref:proline-rich membrane anchor 1-like isoform X2 n=1 Tax=Cololabis saira TaxID=129043 RepID=UPI002AD34E9B|nr:proline-rich membrane anchor 1-like isoform X2 [Cololabis saira]